MCPALRGLWDWWWWALWHHARLSSSWHLLSPGMFWARRRLFLRLTARNRSPASKQLAWVCYRNHRRRLSEHRIWCGILRLCAQNTLTVLLFTCNSPKTVIFLKHVRPVLVSHREPGPVTHDHQLKIQKSVFSTPQSTKLWPVCSCLSVLKYSTIQFRKVHDNESSYRTTQTQAVINSPIITPCRISWKHMLITIDPQNNKIHVESTNHYGK